MIKKEKLQFFYHLKEMKARFIYLSFSYILTFLSCYYFSLELIYLFVRPVIIHEKLFIFTEFADAFSTLLKVSGITALLLILPFLMYHICFFFMPSCYIFERKKLFFFMVFFLFFFFLSILISYFFLLPAICDFLLNFEIQTKILKVQLEPRINTYVTFILHLYIYFIFLFQLPFLFFLIFQLNIINVSDMVNFRKYGYIFFLFLGAFFSPPDILSQLIVALFFCFFFELILFIGFICEKKNCTKI